MTTDCEAKFSLARMVIPFGSTSRRMSLGPGNELGFVMVVAVIFTHFGLIIVGKVNGRGGSAMRRRNVSRCCRDEPANRAL
jgi:hypothetical protein